MEFYWPELTDHTCRFSPLGFDSIGECFIDGMYLIALLNDVEETR